MKAGIERSLHAFQGSNHGRQHHSGSLRAAARSRADARNPRRLCPRSHRGSARSKKEGLPSVQFAGAGILAEQHRRTRTSASGWTKCRALAGSGHGGRAGQPQRRGYEKTRNLMKLNGFLGELVGAPRLLGEWCYQLHVFGEPSATEPWGWQLSGHHLVSPVSSWASR